MFEVRAFDRNRPTTDDEQRDAARVARAWTTVADRSVLGRGRRLVNRLGDRRKDAFVERFVAVGTADDYPAPPDDLADENAFPFEPAASDNAAPARRAGTLGATLAAEIERAYALTDCAGPDAVVLAGSLLRSEHSVERLDLSETAPSSLSVPFVLAHLEALGYGLEPRLSASIARRATLVLLDHHTTTETAA